MPRRAQHLASTLAAVALVGCFPDREAPAADTRAAGGAPMTTTTPVSRPTLPPLDAAAPAATATATFALG